LTREGVDLYRLDFNIDPLGFWRKADAPDRQGMTENLHVQGYLAYWDELRRRHPDMLIDSCASGGRRNDLETLRRAVPLLRSDYQEPQNPTDPKIVIGNQGHTYGLSFWVPYYGTGQFANDTYAFRSHLCPAMGIGFVPGKQDWECWQRAKEDWQWAGPNFYGDYYPLTDYNLADDEWLAWQFHRPEADRGMVQAFRRPKCTKAQMWFRLRGLDRTGTYLVEKPRSTGGNANVWPATDGGWPGGSTRSTPPVRAHLLSAGLQMSDVRNRGREPLAPRDGWFGASAHWQLAAISHDQRHARFFLQAIAVNFWCGPVVSGSDHAPPSPRICECTSTGLRGVRVWLKMNEVHHDVWIR